MKSKLICLFCCAIAFQQAASAQGLLKKLKNKVEQSMGNATGNRLDKEINKAADKPFSGKKKNTTSEANESLQDTVGVTASNVTDPNRVRAWSKFDFIAGSELLLADDFMQDEPGSFPGGWNTNGKGEIVHLNDGKEKWLKLSQGSIYLTPNTQTLPESFTIEFDLLLDLRNKGWSYPELRFTLFNSGALKPTDNGLFNRLKAEQASIVTIQPGEYNNSGTVFLNYAAERELFKTPFKSLKLVEDNYRKPMHIAISVHQQRFRLWIDEEKVYDLPKAIAAKFNQFAIGISSSNYPDDQVGLYFTGFKLAGGLPAAPSKLLTEGKLVSTAICFDVNSAGIKPASYAAIKEIAAVLKTNPAVNIRIVGHTDNDGEETFNKTLSLQRAEAVKQALVEQHGIDADRIRNVEGKGEAIPVAENSTSVGKAKNRRVEFIKL